MLVLFSVKILGHVEVADLDNFQVEEHLEDKQMVVRYKNAKGETRCHGGKDLKRSQAYPKQWLVFLGLDALVVPLYGIGPFCFAGYLGYPFCSFKLFWGDWFLVDSSCSSKCQPAFSPSAGLPSQRFGVAISKCRSLHKKRLERKARKFIKESRETKNGFNMKSRVNRAWIAGANLQPVLDYLAAR